MPSVAMCSVFTQASAALRYMPEPNISQTFTIKEQTELRIRVKQTLGGHETLHERARQLIFWKAAARLAGPVCFHVGYAAQQLLWLSAPANPLLPLIGASSYVTLLLRGGICDFRVAHGDHGNNNKMTRDIRIEHINSFGFITTGNFCLCYFYESFYSSFFTFTESALKVSRHLSCYQHIFPVGNSCRFK